MSPLITRTAKLALLRARLRRQFAQVRRSQKANMKLRSFQEKALKALIVAAQHSSQTASRAILEIRGDSSKYEKYVFIYIYQPSTNTLIQINLFRV